MITWFEYSNPVTLRIVSPGFPFTRLFLLCILIPGCAVLRADTIYTNFGAGSTYSAGTGLIVTNDAAGPSVAIGFTPAFDYNLTSIEFVATDIFTDDSPDVTIGIFADNGGQPAETAIESFAIGPLGQFGEAVPVMTVTSVLQPLLQANTLYWVGMDGPAGSFIVWNQNATLATGFSVTDGSGNWSASSSAQGVVEIDGNLATVAGAPDPASTQSFSGSTPEPRAAWLIAGGLAAIAYLTRRRDRRALRRPETGNR